MVTDPTQIAIIIFDEFPAEVSNKKAWQTAVDAAEQITGGSVIAGSYEETMAEVEAE